MLCGYGRKMFILWLYEMQFRVNLLQQSGNLKYDGGLTVVIAPVR